MRFIFFLSIYPVVPASFNEDFLHPISLMPLSQIDWLYMCGSIPGLPHPFLVCLYANTICLDCYRFLIHLKIRYCWFSNLSLLLKDDFGHCSPLDVYINFGINSSIYSKKFVEILIGIILNLQIKLGRGRKI